MQQPYSSDLLTLALPPAESSATPAQWSENVIVHEPELLPKILGLLRHLACPDAALHGMAFARRGDEWRIVMSDEGSPKSLG